MRVRRPSDSAFDRLPGYAFAPHHLERAGVRTHYLDEGGDELPPVLLVHGLPGWSYAYRRVAPILVEAGCRVVAPDLIGCGKSDRPVDPEGDALARHVGALVELVDELGLAGATLIGDDVGALLALALIAERPARFARAVLIDPCVPRTGEALPPTLARWVALAARPVDEVPRASSLARERCGAPLSPQEAAGYDAPFGDEGPAAAIAELGGMLASPEVAAAGERLLAGLGGWRGRLALVGSSEDPRARAAVDRVAAAAPGGGVGRIAGAVVELGRPAVTEDRGPELAAAILGSIRGAR